MKHVTYAADASKISKHVVEESIEELEVYRQHLLSVKHADEYSFAESSLMLPFDEHLVEKSDLLARHLLKKAPELIIVIGIGGSNLGTIAVQQAVTGKMHNSERFPKIVYADTVDTDALYDIITLSRKTRGHIILNVVSKSGKTTETIANMRVLLSTIGESRCSVVATTDEGSALWNIAQKQNWYTLPIPKRVGGRYSVFSPVGIFPLQMIGINTHELLNGARDAVDIALSDETTTMTSAAVTTAAMKWPVHDTFIFSSDLESVGKWYRQLYAESLGKEYNNDGDQVFSGNVPTVSIGSTDLHSIGQLYLGGPKHVFTTFVEVKETHWRLQVPQKDPLAHIVDDLSEKSVSTIMDAIVQGVQKAYKNMDRPFARIIVKDKSAYSIGYLLQWKMIEVMMMGYLTNVDAFNQPNVESYKTETRALLKKNN